MSKMTKAINEIKTKLDSISGLDGKAADVVEGVLLPAVTEICNSLDLSDAKKKLFCNVKPGKIFASFNKIRNAIEVYISLSEGFTITGVATLKPFLLSGNIPEPQNLLKPITGF